MCSCVRRRGDEEAEEREPFRMWHLLLFCTSPFSLDEVCKEATLGGGSSSDYDEVSSASSGDLELPPPIPAHKEDPSTLYPVDPPTPEVLPRHPPVLDLAPASDGRLPPPRTSQDPEVMTPEEAETLLSDNIVGIKERTSRREILSDAEAREVTRLLTATPETSVDGGAASCLRGGVDEAPRQSSVECVFDPEGEVVVARAQEVLFEDGIHYFEDGHFWVEVPGLGEGSDEDEEWNPVIESHKSSKLRFATTPIQVYSTYSITEYDRKNDEVDPVAASAEYELEKRVEKMDVFDVDIDKGEGGLGLSIIGMGVGADAGVEKLGIFVKTITPGGATEKDGRIQVNDQILEVDGKSLVGVTQVFAASVLKNTTGTVHFSIGREKDPNNSEVALLIKQSLEADRERDERRRALEGPGYDPHMNQGLYDALSSPSEGNSHSEELSEEALGQNHFNYGEGEADIYEPPELSNEEDIRVLKIKLKEVNYRNALYESEIISMKEKLAEIEEESYARKQELEEKREEIKAKLENAQEKLKVTQAEIQSCQEKLDQCQSQYTILEKKYYKAKKIIKEYQSRERDFMHREEYHITQQEEKDAHYNALVKTLKDRVICLENHLSDLQKKTGIHVQPAVSEGFFHQSHMIAPLSLPQKPLKAAPHKLKIENLESDLSDTELPDSHSLEEEKVNTVERKVPPKEEFDEAVPQHELLDVSASRAKGELASRGGLSNRQLPSLKKVPSNSSTGEKEADQEGEDGDIPCPEKSPDSVSKVREDLPNNSYPHQPPPAPVLHPVQVYQQDLQRYPVRQPPPYFQAVQSYPSAGSTSSAPPPPYNAQSPHTYSTQHQLSYASAPYHQPSCAPSPGSSHFQFMHQNVPQSFPPGPVNNRFPLPAHAVHQLNSTFRGGEKRAEIPYRHPPPVARVLPVNRVEPVSGSASNKNHSHVSGDQQLGLYPSNSVSSTSVDNVHSSGRGGSPTKKSSTQGFLEDVRQGLMQADVCVGKKPHSVPVYITSAPSLVSTGPVSSHQGQQLVPSHAANLSPSEREAVDMRGFGPLLPHMQHQEASSPHPVSPTDSIPSHPVGSGENGFRETSSGPTSLGSGDESSGTSLDSQGSFSQSRDEKTPASCRDLLTPVCDWSKEQVCQWLSAQGLESCVPRFQAACVSGPRLINLDARDLKSLSVPGEDKARLKRKVKELRLQVEKERKQVEKEKKEKEKLQKKAEKLAEKAEKKSSKK